MDQKIYATNKSLGQSENRILKISQISQPIILITLFCAFLRHPQHMFPFKMPKRGELNQYINECLTLSHEVSFSRWYFHLNIPYIGKTQLVMLLRQERQMLAHTVKSAKFSQIVNKTNSLQQSLRSKWFNI